MASSAVNGRSHPPTQINLLAHNGVHCAACILEISAVALKNSDDSSQCPGRFLGITYSVQI
jgi:hypothetical protein